MTTLIFASLSVLGFCGLTVATLIRRQYIYAAAFLCAVVWIVFALAYVPGIMVCFE